MCENGVETHLAKKSFLRFGDGHEPVIRKGGVYFVNAQTVNACVRADGCTEKTREYNLMGDQKNREYKLMDSQKKTDAYELMDSQKIDEYELMDSQKTDAYKLMDSQKTDACMTDSQKTREYEVTGAQKKIDAYKLMDSQKTHEYEVTGAQKKIDVYKVMDSQKIDEYELMDSQKTREYNQMGALKSDAYEMMDARGTREYKMMSAQKTDAYKMTSAQNVRVDESKYSCEQIKKVKNPCVQNSSCVGVRKNDGVEIIHNYQRKRASQDADVKPVVRDPMDDVRVRVESGAKMSPVPHEPSEFEKQKHHLTHIPFQPWCTSCVKGKAQAEPHKRTERIIEDSELPVIQCHYLMLKDVAGTGGLKVLSMYVRTFGYGMSTVVETKGPTDMFATRW